MAITRQVAMQRVNALVSRLRTDEKGAQHTTRLFGECRTLINTIFRDSTPSFRISISGVRSSFDRGLAKFVLEDAREEVMEIGRELCEILLARGYRSSALIHSAQEHLLIGSTVALPDTDEDRRANEEPYMPIGILFGNLSPEEVKRARELEAFVNVPDTSFVIDPGSPVIVDELFVCVRLEELDGKNRTVRDPRVVQVVGDEIVVVPDIPKADDFYFRRD